MSRCQRVLVGLLVAGLAAAPALTEAAAPKKAPAKKPAAKGNVAAGKAAFKAEGCVGCHKTKDYPNGGEVGPDLSTVGKEHTAAQIAAYTKKPKAGSVMPAFKGPDKVLNDLAAYLATQK